MAQFRRCLAVEVLRPLLPRSRQNVVSEEGAAQRWCGFWQRGIDICVEVSGQAGVQEMAYTVQEEFEDVSENMSALKVGLLVGG